MTEVDPIRIECPGCHRKFRLRARPKDASRRAVKCPKCGSAIPLPRPTPPPTPRSSESSKPSKRGTSDEDLRAMLRKVKRKTSQEREQEQAEADVTQPSVNVPDFDDDGDGDETAVAPSDITQPTRGEEDFAPSDATLRDDDTAMAPSDVTQPDPPHVEQGDETAVMPGDIAARHGVGDTTQPGLEAGDATLPIGQTAFTADELGTSDRARGGRRKKRKRQDTPRAGSQMARLSRSSPSTRSEDTPRMPEVDEPTYTGPAPGRTPKITPTDHELERFLKPGNYMVRVEDIVYAPVTEKALADIVDAGVILGVDEIATDDGVWSAIDTGDLLGGIKARLSHRAHHILSRVAEKKPASEYGRPPAEPEPSQPQITPSASQSGGSGVEVAPFADAPVTEPDAEVKKRQPDATEAVEITPAQEGGSRKWRLIIPAALFLFLILGTATVWMAAPERVATMVSEFAPADRLRALLGKPPAEPQPKVNAVATEDDDEDTAEVDPTPAFQSVRAAVRSAWAVANSIDGLLNGARAAGDEDVATTLAYMKWKREPSQVDGSELTRQLMQRGKWRAARRVATYLIATEGESETLREIVDESIERQFADKEPLEVTTDRFTRLVHVDPGHRPALVVEDAEGGRWKMWPDLGDDHWRGDVAVYRLCQLMVCHFEIPRTRPMVMSKKTWRALMKSADSATSEMAKRVRGDFEWDDKRLEGSIRKLPRDAVPWPVEATPIWRPWLTTGPTSPAALSADAKDGHLRVAFLGAEKVFPELDGVPARQLARQISTMLLVDYLVGNWNRFAPREDQWGSRTRIHHGLIYSVDDSAAFLGDDSVRVNGRFSWSQRFSKAAIDSLERLEEERVNELLFPDASKAEKEKLDSLWAQRRRALRRIRKLVKEYGADDVFSLDGSPQN